MTGWHRSNLLILFHASSSGKSPIYGKIQSHSCVSGKMQRTPFSPPQKSPELFHPRPQHISQVPMMRSPPPPVSQQSQQQAQVNSYGNPYQSAPAGGGNVGGTGFGPGFNFMNDPTAQMGFQVGQHAVKAGQEYMEQNVCLNSPRGSGICDGGRRRAHLGKWDIWLTPSLHS